MQMVLATCRLCCNVLQYVALCCRVLQCVAVSCSVLQQNGTVLDRCQTADDAGDMQVLLQCVAVWCSVLQGVAGCCSLLQCVAVCCSVLQCVAVFCSKMALFWSAVKLRLMLGTCRILSMRDDLQLCASM